MDSMRFTVSTPRDLSFGMSLLQPFQETSCFVQNLLFVADKDVVVSPRQDNDADVGGLPKIRLIPVHVGVGGVVEGLD